MGTQLDWIPVFCKQARVGTNLVVAIQRFTTQARLELDRLCRTRALEHHSWQAFHLARKEALGVRKALRASASQFHHLERSLSHLEQFVIEGHAEALSKALIQWERADRQYRDYQALRLTVDPLIHNRIARAG